MVPYFVVFLYVMEEINHVRNLRLLWFLSRYAHSKPRRCGVIPQQRFRAYARTLRLITKMWTHDENFVEIYFSVEPPKVAENFKNGLEISSTATC